MNRDQESFPENDQSLWRGLLDEAVPASEPHPATGLSLYPNPATSEFILESRNHPLQQIILSDLAEHLGLRTRSQLLELIASAGLRVLGRHDVKPRHPRASDELDALHEARGSEVTSLWRLGPA